MESGLWVTFGVATAVLLALMCLLLVVVVGSTRRTQRALDAAHADVAAMRGELDSLAKDVASSRTTDGSDAGDAGVVITEVGSAHRDDFDSTGVSRGAEPVDRVVLPATLGEPLVKVVAFGYGVRRALAPASRNRIAFEIKREIKRVRKQRRRDARTARRSEPRSHAVPGSEWEADAAA